MRFAPSRCVDTGRYPDSWSEFLQQMGVQTTLTGALFLEACDLMQNVGAADEEAVAACRTLVDVLQKNVNRSEFAAGDFYRQLTGKGGGGRKNAKKEIINAKCNNAIKDRRKTRKDK